MFEFCTRSLNIFRFCPDEVNCSVRETSWQNANAKSKFEIETRCFASASQYGKLFITPDKNSRTSLIDLYEAHVTYDYRLESSGTFWSTHFDLLLPGTIPEFSAALDFPPWLALSSRMRLLFDRTCHGIQIFERCVGSSAFIARDLKTLLEGRKEGRKERKKERSKFVHLNDSYSSWLIIWLQQWLKWSSYSRPSNQKKYSLCVYLVKRITIARWKSKFHLMIELTGLYVQRKLRFWRISRFSSDWGIYMYLFHLFIIIIFMLFI